MFCFYILLLFPSPSPSPCPNQMRNAIGSIIETRKIPFTPNYFAVGPLHIVASNERTVYTWQYQSQVQRGGSSTVLDEGVDTSKSTSIPVAGRAGAAKEKMFDIETAHLSPAQSPENFTITTDTCIDPIICSALSDRYLAVARKSGIINRYTLPHLTPENVYSIKSEPFRMVLQKEKYIIISFHKIFN